MHQKDELTIEHVAWSDPRAVALRDDMDAEMEARYGSHDSMDPERPERFSRAFAVDESTIRDTVLILDDDAPVAHACLRMLQTDDGVEWEIKRVIVDGARRGRGLGRALLNEVIEVARRGGARRVILQVGTRQPEAIGLYTRLGFTPIPVYPPYAEVLPHSFGFELVLD
ncbi:GNAT family N-acetyltransferase [Herbiconiux solani]|uniref:GNAT family N-acetyltransferase n=1 Tax=Herbiconiux solani TaxID=661329 RepID=UPI0008257658|nr:GNAT family N-acetyltransferase [Herbiconiux solani]